jgi:hypothetical protein
MTELRKRMIECLQLRGLSERTQEAYVRAVRQLAEHYHKSPDLISEEGTAPVLSLHQECQTLLPQHHDHRHLWPLVFL